jgi:hypothetical protein
MEELITTDQALMPVQLLGTPQQVAEKTRINQQRVKENLDNLYNK